MAKKGASSRRPLVAGGYYSDTAAAIVRGPAMWTTDRVFRMLWLFLCLKMGLAVVSSIQAHNLHGASVAIGGSGDWRIITVGMVGVNLGVLDRRSAIRGVSIT